MSKTARFIEGNMLQEIELMPCPCMCHRNPHIKHIAPCCKNGFIETIGKTFPAPDCKFKVGEVYEEGKDYKIIIHPEIIIHPDDAKFEGFYDCFYDYGGPQWKPRFIAVPIKAEESQYELAKPSISLLIKLGSLITHYEEYVSQDGHELDLVAAKSLTEDSEVKEWMAKMNEMAFLPLKRKQQ